GGGASAAPSGARPSTPPVSLTNPHPGRAPTPAFFTVAALAGALGLSMDELLTRCAPEPDVVPLAG
ncbi:XRE family transcriptional regulator, partial [Streptomyces sp. NPDC059153]|uniref:XRE family transcriptional regulator n=1 Tax=Streptomyces sp. NPDC059153 TaxID=3346743 RepID=UPI0036A88F7F